MGKYLDIARNFAARQRAQGAEGCSEAIGSLRQGEPSFGDSRKTEIAPLPWTCRYCGRPLTIDDVCPSLDGERMLTIWRCDPCQVAGVTPDAIQKPPVVWVKTIRQ